MRIFVFAISLFLFVAASTYVVAETQKVKTTKEKLAEKPVKKIDKETMLKVKSGESFLGKANAPVTIIEYISLSCPHCADFHNKVLPELEKKYIETGKLRIVNRDFPLSESALKAAIAARCDESKYYPMIKALFKTQKDWAYNNNFVNIIKNIAQISGLKPDKFDKCMKDKELEDRILNSRLEAEKNLKVGSTPTFFINGKIYEKDKDFKSFEKAIEALLAPKKQ